jgi:hypothetical protein
MANPPENFLTGALDPLQSKTLFLPAPGKLGVLVSQRGRRRAAEPLQFASAAAALAWCVKHRVNLVFFHNSIAEAN